MHHEHQQFSWTNVSSIYVSLCLVYNSFHFTRLKYEKKYKLLLISAEVKITSFIIKGDILNIIHLSTDIVKNDITCLSGFWEFFRGKPQKEPSSCLDTFISLFLIITLYIMIYLKLHPVPYSHVFDVDGMYCTQINQLVLG